MFLEHSGDFPSSKKPEKNTNFTRSVKSKIPLPPIPEEGINELLNAEDSLYIRVYDTEEDYEDGIENDDKSDALNIEDYIKDPTGLKSDLEYWLKTDSELGLNGEYFIRITRNKSDGDEVVIEYTPGMTTWDVSINR